jgi:hypothetical protein
MKEAAFYFTPPYRIGGSDKLSQRVVVLYINLSQPHKRDLPASLKLLQLPSSSLLCPQIEKIQSLRREGLTEEAAIEAVLEGARAQDEVIPGIILVALR